MSATSHFGVGKTGAPAFSTRGIVEGFYGVPWTHPQRLDMIDFIADRGMNTFVYAPKDDPLVRQKWRVPYVGDDLVRLAELARRCAARGVEFVYCLSPGLTMRYSSESDLACLVDKLASVADVGVASFGLLLDDIPTQLQHAADRTAFGDLAAAHEHVVGRVFDQLQRLGAGNRLIVCPTVYWGYGNEDYVVRLGRGIDPRVDFFWTGRAICSATIDLDDAAAITRSIARPVTYWDNYPVNDVAMGNELHIGPYRGRDRHLYRFAEGVIANGMELFESSKIAFATIADYLWSPEDYREEESWRVAMRDVVGEADLSDFALFADTVRSSCLSADDALEVTSAIERFEFGRMEGDPVQASADLAEFAQRLLDAGARLTDASFVNRQLFAEARPWVATFQTGAHALKRLAELSAEGPLTGDARGELAGYLDALRGSGKRVFGDVLDMTLAGFVEDPLTT